MVAVTELARLAVFPRTPIKPGGGKTLADAALQLGVTPRGIQELGGHAASIVLATAGVGAGVGFRWDARRGEEDQRGQDDHTSRLHRCQCGLRHVPPPHSRTSCWAVEPKQTGEASDVTMNMG